MAISATTPTWFHNPQIWMPDLQIDQAIKVRNPIYLNDASSFRLVNSWSKWSKRWPLLQSTKLVRIYEDGKIVWTTLLNYDVNCPMNFVFYPFDQQVPFCCLTDFQGDTNVNNVFDDKSLTKVDLKGLHSRLWELRLHLFWALAQLDAWGAFSFQALSCLLITRVSDFRPFDNQSSQDIASTVGMFVNLVLSRTRGTLPTSTQPGSITRWKISSTIMDRFL